MMIAGNPDPGNRQNLYSLYSGYIESLSSDRFDLFSLVDFAHGWTRMAATTRPPSLYVRVGMTEGVTRKTKVIKRNATPIWGEEIIL
jgi:hypothetical protein